MSPAERLGKLLHSQNLTAVAKLVGMPPTVLHDWVRGRRQPSLRNLRYLKALATYLNMSLSELLTGEPEPSAITSFTFKDNKTTYQILVKKKE